MTRPAGFGTTEGRKPTVAIIPSQAHVHTAECIATDCLAADVERSQSGVHMFVQDCMKVDAKVEALIEDYTGALNDVEHFEERAKLLAGALRRLGTKYKGADGVRTWHYFACPTRHGFPDCDKKCRDADAALTGSA